MPAHQKSPEDRLDDRLDIPLKKDVVVQIKKVSKALGLSPTEWARQSLLEALYPPE